MTGQPEATTVEGPWDDPPQPHGTLLAALRWAWDGAYLIAEDDNGRLVITRSDGYGPSIRVLDPLEARDAIIADFARRPVTHPLDAGALGRRIAFEHAGPARGGTPGGTAMTSATEQDAIRRIAELEARYFHVMIWDPTVSASGEWDAMGDDWTIQHASPVEFYRLLKAKLGARDGPAAGTVASGPAAGSAGGAAPRPADRLPGTELPALAKTGRDLEPTVGDGGIGGVIAGERSDSVVADSVDPGKPSMVARIAAQNAGLLVAEAAGQAIPDEAIDAIPLAAAPAPAAMEAGSAS